MRGAWNGWRGANTSQQCHKYFLQRSTFVSEIRQFRTWERQTCFFPLVSSKLVTPLVIRSRIKQDLDFWNGLFADLDLEFEMKCRIGFGFEKPKFVNLCGLVVSASASVLVGREFDLGRVLPRPCKLILQPSYQGRGVRESCREHKNKPSENEPRNCINSVLALQDHCSYKVPTTNHLNQTNIWPLSD